MNPEDQEVLSSLARRIRSFRLARGMSQRDLAALLGFSVAYVSLLERGLRDPPYTTLVALARALRIRMADLTADD
jgi:transcriptional regulator with XRE-family HTH domain